MGPKNSRAKESDIKYGSPGTGCSGGNGLSGLCMGGGSGSGGGSVENVPVEKQSEKASVEKQSEDKVVEAKGSRDGAVSSASMPMTLLSLTLGFIIA
ncbi:hypothetical protein CRE_12390 [Caenorhabditis remanei]|uniref:Uncharacterized protein n=1 Tax=Caenorhabditis remanei TaxID=31234 RepID=E3NN17_CAERE|nr:hypothetical protein CRE_12390 [Caenorhabditis remanei]